MKAKKKILIGGLGALTPLILNLLVVDLKVLLMDLTFLAVLGYGIRVVVLFYLGGLVAWLHKDENSPVKLFEMGIVAPALITALLNGTHVDVRARVGGSPPTSSIIMPLAYAQTAQTAAAPQRESPVQQFLRGLTGSPPDLAPPPEATTEKKAEKGPTKVVVVGMLKRVVAIGGETTGWVIELATEQAIAGKIAKVIEVEPAGEPIAHHEEKHVEITGEIVTRHGVERGDYRVLKLESIRGVETD